MQETIDKRRFKRIYTMISCLLEKDIDIVIEELKNKSYDSYIMKMYNERLKYPINNLTDIEISFEVLKGIGGYGKVNPDYKNEITEIVYAYTSETIKKLKLDR